MNNFYILDPEVPGRIGPHAKLDRNVHPPKVYELHFVFDGWVGDHIVESFPCYLVTEGLAESLMAEGLTGFNFAEVEVEAGIQYEMMSESALSPFKWLQINGRFGESDMYISPDYRLVCSDRAMKIILATSPKALDYEQIAT